MLSKEDFRSIEDVICDFINKDNVKFVFPSAIAMETWSDWAIKNSSKTGYCAIALENWTEWDTFKREFAQVHDTEKNCIPETLRKLFARSLLKENSELVKNKQKSFLHPLVNDSFAHDSLHFTSWLAAVLPSLDLWNSKFSEKNSENYEEALDKDDGENRVYANLYKRYADFLNKAKMFDPAWVKLNDIDKTYHFVIFHPEQLKDFNDYKEKIEQCNSTLVRLPRENIFHPVCTLYPNARMELRRTVLKIRELHEKHNISWLDIALSVPNLKANRPYIERELNLYCIPFAVRSGVSYTQNSAGRIFEEIKACVENNFNLESVRTILQDGFIPYRKIELNEKIIQTALETRSICSYKQNNKIIDPISEAFRDKISQKESFATSEPAQSNTEETENEIALLKESLFWYEGLKKSFESIYNAKTFKSIKESWHSFESNFLKDEKIWQNDKDNIIGICIAELSKHIAIEKEHSALFNFSIEKPFDFFIEELNSNIYTPQRPKNVCISVFDYRAAADAYFDYHFIINASQKNLDVPFKELSFLSEKKRKELGANDNEGATEAYIRLYAKTGESRVFFSNSTNGFDGFAISHTFFNEIDVIKNKDETYCLDNEDFFLNEKKYLLSENSENNATKPIAITTLQKESFLKWQLKLRETKIDIEKINLFFAEKAKEALVYGNYNSNAKKIKITQTDLKDFFPCKRKWIFKKIIRLKEETATVELMAHYDFGNICHKIVELIFEEYSKTEKPLPDLQNTLDNESRILLRKKIETAVEKTLTEKETKTKENDFRNSRLAMDVLLAQKHIFSDYIMSFMEQICKTPEKEESGVFAGSAVNSVEKSFSAELNEKYELYGKIDCILTGNDKDGDIIIDYKTGTIPDKKDCYPNTQNILNNFQISFYYKLLSAQPKLYDVQDALFYSLKKNNKDVFDKKYIISKAGKEQKDQSKKIFTAQEFEDNVLSLLDLYLNDFTHSLETACFEPLTSNNNERMNVKTYVHCKSCDYSDICRTTFTVAREEL